MNMTNWIFFGPALLIEQYAHAGFVIGFTLILAQGLLTLIKREPQNRNWFMRAPVLAGMLWLIFNLYEWQVTAAFERTIFRMDLLVLVPLLYVLTGYAIWVLVKSFVTSKPK